MPFQFDLRSPVFRKTMLDKVFPTLDFGEYIRSHFLGVSTFFSGALFDKCEAGSRQRILNLHPWFNFCSITSSIEGSLTPAAMIPRIFISVCALASFSLLSRSHCLPCYSVHSKSFYRHLISNQNFLRSSGRCQRVSRGCRD